MTKDQYVCQRAANAIISEIGPYQISSDALQSINQFLDQVLILLLQRAHSLDLSIIKSQVLNLLPLTLGKNAIVEAELEVKTYSETSVIDYPLYERMRSLHSTNSPLDQIYNTLRHQCIDHCTLANKTSDSSTYNTDNDQGLAISPMVIIYITTVLEHMAEYILTTIAVTAEHEDTEYIRVKDVYLALLDDVQVGGLFQQTDIRTKLEKRVISYQAQHQPYQRTTLPSPAPSPAASYKNEASVSQDTFDHHHTPELYSIKDDNDIDDDDLNSEPPPSAHTQTSFSIKSTQTSSFYRPISVISNATTATSQSTSSSKKGFRFFGKKEKRSSVASHSTANTNHQQDYYRRTMSPPPSALGYSPSSVQVYDPDAPALDFEDLIRSGNTMKVSLTPNRLRSIEVKSTVYEPSINNNISSPKSTISSPTSPIGNGKSLPSPSSHLPPISAPFENPRAAPKPPVAHHPLNMAAKHQQTPPLTPDSSIASRLSNTRSPPPSFEEGQRQQKQAQRTYVNNKYIKQPPPAPLQLVGRTDLQHKQQHRKQASMDTEGDEVCVMDLPSPPNTTDHHPSSSTFSILSSNQPNPSTSTPTSITKSASLSSVSSNKPRYNRPSSMVAKRASGSARPPSYHESFALTIEQQQSQNGSTPWAEARSSPAGHIGSVSGDQTSTTIPIAPSPLRPSAPSIPSSKSTPESSVNIEPVMTPTRTMMRRRTTRPLSQMIAVEEEYGILDQDKDDIERIGPVQQPIDDSSNGGLITEAQPTEAKVSLPDKDITFAKASCNRRDRILHLLQQQRKSVMVDSSMQTDPLPGIPSLATLLASLSTSPSVPTLVVSEESGQQNQAGRTKDGSDSMTGSEQGLVDGDEEWFMQDEDWDDTQDQDSAMAEWLLGEN